MPLDGHSYLVAQGWSGKGSGLRQGAISRPLAIPQKKTLAGLGKDRDEAFPFWDHLFSVAAKTIQVKIHKDEDDDSTSDSSSSPVLPALPRTSTGILSNKRPTTGTPASSSGSATPNVEVPSSDSCPSMSLLSRAKRDAARRGLYSRFFRGPVLSPDDSIVVEEIKVASTSVAEFVSDASHGGDVSQHTGGDITTDKRRRKDERQGKKKREQGEEERTAKKSKEERKERENKKKDKKDKRATTEKKLREKGKEKEKVDSAAAGEPGEEQKQRRKRKREANPGDGTSPHVSREEDRQRSKKTKRRDEVEAITKVVEESKSSTRTKEEKRRRKAEKAEKRRRKALLQETGEQA